MRRGGNGIGATLAELAALDRDALAECWTAAFGCPAPKHSRAAFLRRVLAWHVQVQATPEWCGVRGASRLTRLARSATPAQPLAPGSQLVREWQGRTYRVVVLAEGFECDGVRYRSLTAITRQITGTAWSGPLLFGLRP
jgi:hypothetical protein